MSPEPYRSVTTCRLAALVSVLLLSLGCQRLEGPEEISTAPTVPRRGGTLVIAIGNDIHGINPLISGVDTQTTAVLDRLFLHLFEEQADYTEHPPTFEPRLVESFEWSADGRTLDLELRSGVSWSDGVPVTAEDVRWTWQAQTDPELAWGYAQSKQNIRDVEIVDQLRLRIHFHQRSPSQLAELNEGVILPKHAWSELPFSEWRSNEPWFVDHLIVNGPFDLESWARQEQIVLLRNESYFESELPRLDRVILRVVPQKQNQLGELLAGEVDFVEQVPPSEVSRLEEQGAQILRFWARQFNYLCWNTQRRLFADPEVRRALTMAIDRQEIIDTLWYRFARIAVSPILTSIWAHDPDLRPVPFDLEASRRVLQSKGWSDTDGDGILDKEGEPFSFELITNTGSQVRIDAAVMVQEHLRRAGIEARVRQLEFNTVVSRALEHDFDAMLGGWDIDTSLDLTYAFHSQSIDDGYNFGQFSDADVDRLIDATNQAMDPAERMLLLREVESILHRTQPYTFLWEPQRLAAASNRLRDATPSPVSSYFRLREWWLAEAD
ncbi:MAG: ABC transporter substrate-binding protein [Thermoanaerobaculia bacterium]